MLLLADRSPAVKCHRGGSLPSSCHAQAPTHRCRPWRGPRPEPSCGCCFGHPTRPCLWDWPRGLAIPLLPAAFRPVYPYSLPACISGRCRAPPATHHISRRSCRRCGGRGNGGAAGGRPGGALWPCELCAGPGGGAREGKAMMMSCMMMPVAAVVWCDVVHGWELCRLHECRTCCSGGPESLWQLYR